MEPGQLLLLYPAETLSWLRRRLRLDRRAFAAWVGAPESVIARWERGDSNIPRVIYLRLLPLLERYLATPEGQAFVQTVARLDAEARDDPR